MTRTGTRLPKFRREREGIRSFQFTLRDRAIILQVARLKFLRSTQVCRLVEGSAVQIARRLQLLYHHGWLDRPRCQLDFYHQGGSRPMVYGLGSRAVAMLRREENLPFSRMVWGRRGQDVGRAFLEHTLLVAEVVMSMEKACERVVGVRFAPSEELESGQSGREPFAWKVTLDGRQVGLVPDAVFGIDYEKPDGMRERLIICVEADRGTMPVLRRTSHLSSIGRKLETYAALWRAGRFEKRFHTKRIAVLTVTTSDKRVSGMQDAIAKLPHGRGLFTCCTEDGFEEKAVELIERWKPMARRAADREAGI